MNEEEFLDRVRRGVEVNFNDLMSIIDENYTYSAAAFLNGDTSNNENENQGSAKLFCFAAIQQLSKGQTLSCFGEHYQSVIGDPDGESHQNIRSFMIYGWEGLKFESPVLTRK
ncbi:MAG TPA: HopJ type III effector protein [Candidatus Thioglobus sp.]|nr:HopJ type III effector protein [Candidatus Thioglobus sp.]HIL42874.1 HopJ type III effector protein [Gammaproteobacteria bacterium]